MLQANRAYNTIAAVAPPSAKDPVVALLREHAAEWAAFEAGPGDDDCPHYARCVEIEAELEVAKATTSDGAVASLEYLRADLLQHVLDGLAENHARLYLGLIDNALGVQRKLGHPA